MDKKNVTALALFSGGLDSILACRVVAAQGIKVKAIKFISPFFGYDLLAEQDEYVERCRKAYGIDVTLIDITPKYLELLHDPPHGFGKHFNPCVDCKILLMTEARHMMPAFNASFLISGEVLGQRPMSQRRDTLWVIERDSGCAGILVRPLCAGNLEPTRVERDGLIDRDQLLAFKGRSRIAQMELAEQFGITDYPSPAGGCLLTDPTLGQRIRLFYQEEERITADDIRLLLVGRHFRLPRGGLLAVGRKQAENERILQLASPDDRILKMADRPGPVAVLRHSDHADDIAAAAGLVVRYGKKVNGRPAAATVQVAHETQTHSLAMVQPLTEDVYRSWMR